jgi:hypothetical protein
LGKGLISQTPHTITSSYDSPTINFTSYNAGTYDIAFGFDSDDLKPKKAMLFSPHTFNVTKSYTCDYEFNYTTDPKRSTCYIQKDVDNGTSIYDIYFDGPWEWGDIPSKTVYWNASVTEKYKDISDKFNKTQTLGKDWYYIQDVTFTENETKSILIDFKVTPKTGVSEGKYDLCVKPSSLTVFEAWQQDKLFCIDPWWNISCLNRFEIISTAQTSDIPISVNDTSLFLSNEIWTNNRTEPFFVYNCTTFFPVANETDELNWENVSQELTGNNPMTVWSTQDERYVWHMTNSSGNGIILDSLGNKVLTPVADAGSNYPTDVDGVFYVAQRYNTRGPSDQMHHKNSSINGSICNSDCTILAFVQNNFDTLGGEGWGRVVQFGNTASADSVSLNSELSDTDRNWTASIFGGNSVTAKEETRLNEWYCLALTINGGNNMSLFVNGSLQNSTSISPSIPASANIGIGARGTSDDNICNCTIDEVRIFGKKLSQTAIQDYCNNGFDNLVTLGASENISGLNTSLFHVDFPLNDTIFDSAAFVAIGNFTFNTTFSQNFTLKGSMNIKKETLPQASVVTLRITANGSVILEEVIRTVATTADIGVATIPFTRFVSNVGENNLLVEVSEVGQGSVNISKFRLHADCELNAITNEVTTALFNDTFTYSATTFASRDTFNVTKAFNSETIIDMQHRFGANASVTPSCYLSNTNQTITYSRFLENAADIGSSGVNYFDSEVVNDTEWNVICAGDNDAQTENNISIYWFSLRDSNDNLINAVQNTTDSLLSLSSGETTILTGTHNIAAGDEIDGILTIIAQSDTGIQTPTFTLEINNGSASQILAYRRYFSSDDDVGTIKMYDDLENVLVGDTITYELNITVDPGETLNVSNATILFYETRRINTSVGNLPPLPNVITNPENGSNVLGNDTITWLPFTDPNGQEVTYNISLRNTDGSFNATINDSITQTSTPVNWDTFDKDRYFLVVEGCDPDDLCGNTTITVTVIGFRVSIQSPENITYTTDTIPLNWTSNIAIDWAAYSLNGGSNITLTTFFTGDEFSVSEMTLPNGITNNGTYFWITDNTDDLVYRYFMNGTFDRTFSLNVGNTDPRGIAQNGTFIWIMDGSVTQSVYRYDMNMSFIDSTPVSVALHNFRGVTTNNTFFWLTATHSATPHRIRKYQFINFTFISSTNIVDSPRGIDADDQFLWIIESNRFVIERFYRDNSTTTGLIINASNEATDVFGVTKNDSFIWITSPTDLTVYKYFFDQVNPINTTIVAAQGQNNLTVFANTSTGDANSSTVLFFVDSIDPIITIVEPQNITYCDTNPQLNFSFIETNPDTCWYSLNGSANITLASCNTNGTEMVSSEGGNNVRLCMNDTLGTEDCDQSFWTKDSTTPSITINDPTGTVPPAIIPFNFTFSEPVDTVRYAIDGGANVTVPNPGTELTGNLPAQTGGEHNITVWVNDTCLHENETTSSFTVTVPYFPPDGSTQFNQFLFNFSNPVEQPNATTCFYILNGLEPQNYTCGIFNVTINSNIGENNLTICWNNITGTFCNATFFNVSIRCSSSEVNDTICSGKELSYIVMCRQISRDAFQFDYSNMTFCEFGCQDGNCIDRDACVDNCLFGESMCNKDRVIRCRERTDGCLDWSSENQTFCRDGCKDGRCVGCVDECSIGDSRCEGTRILFCDDDNGDGCFEFSQSNVTDCQFGCFEELNVTTGRVNVTCNLHSFGDIYAIRQGFNFLGWSFGYVFNDLNSRLWITIIAMVILGGLAGLKTDNWRFGLLVMSGIVFLSSWVGFIPWVVGFIYLIFIFMLWTGASRREGD